MRRTQLASLLFCLLCMQLSGCVSTMFVEATQPPAVTVGHDQWKVLVINRFDASLLPYKIDRKAEVFRDGAYQAAGGAMGAIFSDSTFVLVNTDSAVAYPSPASAPRLTPEEIHRLQAKHPAHLILSLDNFDVGMGKDVETAEDEDGSKTKTAHYTLFVSTNWTLYDSTGQVVDQAALTLDAHYNSRPVISGLLAVGPSMANAGAAVNQLAVESGYSYWDRLYPQTTILERQVHTQPPFMPALMHAYTQKWQQAIEVLLPLATDNSFKHRVKAAHNLAVVYEAIGNFEQATYWARQAESKGDKLAVQLIQEWSRTGRNKSLQVMDVTH